MRQGSTAPGSVPDTLVLPELLCLTEELAATTQLLGLTLLKHALKHLSSLLTWRRFSTFMSRPNSSSSSGMFCTAAAPAAAAAASAACCAAGMAPPRDSTPIAAPIAAWMPYERQTSTSAVVAADARWAQEALRRRTCRAVCRHGAPSQHITVAVGIGQEWFSGLNIRMPTSGDRTTSWDLSFSSVQVLLSPS